MTVSINYGSVADAASPYDATASSSGAVGDILICAATSFEFTGSPGSRTLAMVTAGWTQLALEDFELYPSTGRRAHLATWYKVATTTSDTVNVTLSGATYTFLTLNVGVIRLTGLPTTVVAQSAATRRDNVDNGVNPALTWTHTPSTASASQTSLLIRYSHNPDAGSFTAPTGYALPVHLGGSLNPWMQLHGGDTTCFAFYGTGPTSTLTFANHNGCSIVASLTLDFAYPVLTHTGAMTT